MLPSDISLPLSPPRQFHNQTKAKGERRRRRRSLICSPFLHPPPPPPAPSLSLSLSLISASSYSSRLRYLQRGGLILLYVPIVHRSVLERRLRIVIASSKCQRRAISPPPFETQHAPCLLKGKRQIRAKEATSAAAAGPTAMNISRGVHCAIFSSVLPMGVNIPCSTA